MDRRELLRTIAALTGCAFVGAEPASALVYVQSVDMDSWFDSQIKLLDEIAETILPRTDTPGAKDAKVGEFIARYAPACYTPAQIGALMYGLGEIDKRTREAFGSNFLAAQTEQRRELLVDIDKEAKHYVPPSGKTPEESPHYFVLLKQLTLYGFFTSESGATQVLRYRPIPGAYKGSIPYKKGETSWS